MSDSYFVDAKKVALGGYFHLLQSPFGAAVTKEHSPNALYIVQKHCFGLDVVAGVVLAPYWLLPLQWRQTWFDPSWNTFLWYCNFSKKTSVYK